MEVRYVGWRSKSAAARLRHHIQESISQAKTHKHHWILSLVSIGLVPLMETIEAGSGPGYAEAERRWIAHYRAQGARLVNATDGGDGLLGYGTPEQRRARGLRAVANLDRKKLAEERRKWWAGLDPGQRQEYVDRMQRTNAKLTKEQHAERMRAIQASKTSEQRSESAKLARSRLTPDQWTAIAKKAAEAKGRAVFVRMGKLANAALTPEQRRIAAQKRLANTTHDERSDASKRGHVTRAANKARRAQSG